MTTLSVRRSSRIPVSKLGQRSQSEPLPVAPLPEVAEQAAPDIKESMAFCKLSSKNPALRELVQSLDLVEVYSTRMKGEPLLPLAEVVATEPLNPKLKEIAELTFARNRAYSEVEAVNRLASTTATPTDRARNGIARMQAQGILALTLSNEYYLTNSTPF